MTEVRARARRYVLFDEIASGGMATVHYGRSRGAAGFARTVAIKRMHAALAKDADFAAMFVDEARVAARIHHPAVVEILDVVAENDELLLVLEYVHGESLAGLIRKSQKSGQLPPVPIAAAIATSFLHGLHAAHEARDESGVLLDVIHRDVSPQNVMVGTDGLARLLDFGVAKARSRLRTTGAANIVKGKFAYMPPEQLAGGAITRRVDIYAAGIVLWEMLTARWLFEADDERTLLARVMHPDVVPPSTYSEAVPPVLDRIVMRALAVDPEARFATAREMAIAIEDAVPLATPTRIGAWVEELAGQQLEKRARIVSGIERMDASRTLQPTSEPPSAEAVTIVSAAPTFVGEAIIERGSSREEVASVAGVHAPTEPSRAITAAADEPALTATRSPRRGLLVAAVVVALIIASFLGARGLQRTETGSSDNPPIAAATPSFSATTAVAPPPSVTNVANAGPSVETSATAHPASASTSAKAVTPKTPPLPSAIASTKASAVASTAVGASTAAKPDCDPPYEYDAKGYKVWKVQCL